MELAGIVHFWLKPSLVFPWVFIGWWKGNALEADQRNPHQIARRVPEPKGRRDSEGTIKEVNMAEIKRVKIPVVIGRNRLRGKSEGAMVFDDLDNNTLSTLRKALTEAAEFSSVEPTKEWLTGGVSQILRIYEEAHETRLLAKDGCIGHVYEANLPNGTVLLLGEPTVLARIA
jgi:hypothetical protein